MPIVVVVVRVSLLPLPLPVPPLLLLALSSVRRCCAFVDGWSAPPVDLSSALASSCPWPLLLRLLRRLPEELDLPYDPVNPSFLQLFAEDDDGGAGVGPDVGGVEAADDAAGEGGDSAYSERRPPDLELPARLEYAALPEPPEVVVVPPPPYPLPPRPCTINSLYLSLKRISLFFPFFRYPLTTLSLAFNSAIRSSISSLSENLIAPTRSACARIISFSTVFSFASKEREPQASRERVA